MKSTVSYFNKIVNATLPLCPLLQTYGWGKFDFTFIVTSILIVIWCIKKGFHPHFPKWLSIYFGYYLISQFLSFTSLVSIIPIGWMRMVLIYGLFFSTIDLDLFKKYYTNIGIFCIAFFGVQVVTYYVTGLKIPGVIKQLPIALDVDSSIYFDSLEAENSRFCSFFSEPAHFAQFLFPLLIFKLFTNKINENIFFVIIIIICLLLIQSGNALFGLGMIMLCYFFGKLYTSRHITSVILLIFIPIICIVGTKVYMQTETGQEILERKDQLNGNPYKAQSGLSGFIRIFRGFYVYDKLSTYHKIVGANNTDIIKHAITKSEVSFLFKDDNDMYFNTIQTLLIRTGIIGTAIFIIFLIVLYRQTDWIGRTFIITITGLGFISAMFMTELMLVYLLVPYKLYKYKRYNVSPTYA